MAPPVTITRIWCSSERYHRRRFKFLAYEDVGQLEIRPGTLVFEGRKATRHIDNVRRIDLVRPVQPWGTLAITWLSILAYWGFRFSRSGGHALAPFAISIAVGLVLGFVGARSIRWVRLESAEPDGSIRILFLADGKARGWSNVFGGSRRLAQRLKHEAAGTPPVGQPTYRRMS